MSAGYRALALVALALGLIASGYYWGSSAKDNQWQARQAKAASQAHENFRAEELRSFKASEALQVDLQQQAASYQQLEEAFHDYRNRKAPLARSRVVPATQTTVNEAAPPGCIVVPPESEPVQLTHGAVWMWNSALAGADTLSGTCGLADQSSEACSLEAGVTLEDAWDNHTTNAKACAVDRLRNQRLIDFVKGRQR